MQLTGGIQSREKVLVRGLVKFALAVAYHFCLNLPAIFSQPRTKTFSQLCTMFFPKHQFKEASVNFAGKVSLLWSDFALSLVMLACVVVCLAVGAADAGGIGGVVGANSRRQGRAGLSVVVLCSPQYLLLLISVRISFLLS